MTVTVKVASILVGLVALVLLLATTIGIRSERALLVSDIERDARLVATSLAAVLPKVEGSGADAESLLGRVPRSDSLEVRWVPPSSLEATPEGSYPVLHRDRADVTAVAAVRSADGSLLGAVSVRESLEPAQAYVRRTLGSAAMAGAAIVVLASAISLVLGRALVGIRIDELIGAADAVARGSLDVRLRPRGGDEVEALMTAVNRMTEQLDEARTETEEAIAATRDAEAQLRHTERLATTGRLAAGLAHELGTPLNVISGRATLIADAVPEAAANATIIQQQAERVTRLVARLLEFARRGNLARTATDMVGLCRRVCRLLGPEAEGRDVELLVRAPADWVPARVDTLQMEQVVTNLLLNALQAAPPGSAVELDVSAGRRQARLEVSDRGPGIPEALRLAVFDPFFTTKPVGEGTGLGLSIVHGIVQDHEGTVAVLPREGGGARFVVTIPVGTPA